MLFPTSPQLLELRGGTPNQTFDHVQPLRSGLETHCATRINYTSYAVGLQTGRLSAFDIFCACGSVVYDRFLCAIVSPEAKQSHTKDVLSTLPEAISAQRMDHRVPRVIYTRYAVGTQTGRLTERKQPAPVV